MAIVELGFKWHNNLMQKLILSILIGYSPSFISGFFKFDTTNWYSKLTKPSFSPPSWIFGVVWPILYFLIGLSLYFFWKTDADFEEKKLGYTFFAIQLLLNACFTPIFFAYKSLLGGFVICLLLSIFVLLTILEFYKIAPLSAYLLIPYLLWDIFATFLSFKILLLNS
ncbi:MAG: TspO/MBR family protein [bacterium]